MALNLLKGCPTTPPLYVPRRAHLLFHAGPICGSTLAHLLFHAGPIVRSMTDPSL